jgi:hypothetical protein
MRTRFRRHMVVSDTYSIADEVYMEAVFYRWERRREWRRRALERAISEAFRPVREALERLGRAVSG